jgi:17beta-estradiol 17-dehydrogenase / very-long-chain 3-oxoacyl-CoA reductase
MKIVFDVMGAISKYMLRTGFDIGNRYGNGSYVVITGPAPGGIGAVFAREFAKKGFNLVLLGRTVWKMEATAKSLRTEFKGLHVIEIEADLSRSMEANFFENIADKMKDIDVSILVHNAGAAMFPITFDRNDIDFNRKLIAGNAVPSVLLTQALLPKLKSREKRSAVVFISSALGRTGIASAAVCGATKSFMKTFGEAMAYEYRDKLDVLVSTPFQVHSNLTPEPADGFGIITADSYVRSVFRDLGQDVLSVGHWAHAVQDLILIEWLPKSLLHKIFSAISEAKQKKVG